MKITDVRLYVLEAPEQQIGSAWKLIQVPNLSRTQYTHTRVAGRSVPATVKRDGAIHPYARGGQSTVAPKFH